MTADTKQIIATLEQAWEHDKANKNEKAVESSRTVEPSSNPNRKVSTEVIEHAEEKIEQGAQLGLYESYTIQKAKSFPTLLARLPIFLPLKSKYQKERLDEDLAFKFDTPFGRGRRFGPPVTIKDEDTLFALLRLSEKRLIGQGNKLPISLEAGDQWLRDDEGNLTVQIAVVTIGQIIEEMGLKSKGGKNYRTTLASVKRLNHVSIELETKQRDRYLGESWTGDKIRIVDIKWKTFQEEGLVYAQFTPIIVKWLRESATYYSWDIRRMLPTENAKALHRFLSTQGGSYKAPLAYIADVIEWSGERARLKRDMDKVLRLLKEEHSWCDYEILGKGRKDPFRLEFRRISQ